mgnify:CR=1 FL=1
MADPRPLALVSGFGPFEAFGVNPSAEVAQALAARPPEGLRVRSRILPVSFARAPLVWDELLEGGERPELLLGLGVASRRRGFSLERWAKPQLRLVLRRDVDGRSAREFSADGPRLQTSVDLARLLAALRRRGASEARISCTAGGFVCEHIYHHLLTRAGERGLPGLFVHVPRLCFARLERQVQVVGWVLEELLRVR